MPSHSISRPSGVYFQLAGVIVAPTLLSILAVGAIYANERETGDKLHEISRILIGNVRDSVIYADGSTKKGSSQ